MTAEPDDEADPELEELEEDDDFGGTDLAPPPPPPAPSPGSTREPPQPPPPELVAISEQIAKSSDPLERQALVHAALCASIADVLADTKISAAERRRELRTISAAAAKSFPYRRLYEAERIVKRHERELEDRRRDKAGAKLEDRPKAGKLIPIRGTAIGGGKS